MFNFFYKVILLFAIDAVIIFSSIWLSFLIRLDYFYSFLSINKFIFIFYFIIFFISYNYFKIYKIIIRFIDYYSIIKIIKATFFAQLFLIIVNFFFYKYFFFPRAISFIAPVIILIFVILSRIFLKFLVNFKNKSIFKKRNVVIYGINENTVLFSQTLRRVSFIYNVIGFISNNNDFRRREVNGIEVLKLDDNIINILKKKQITDLFFLENDKNKELDKIFFNFFEKLNIRIIKLSTDNIYLSNFLTGAGIVNKKFDISFDDIIYRPEIKTNNFYLKKKIFNKTILITGAGGSIGSELSLQIANLNPRKLVLLDNSELNLFNIFNKIKSIKNFNIKKINLILGDCSDNNFIKNSLNIYKFDEIYHAAAYKHVKFLEENIFSAIKNNVYGTLNIVNFALKNKVKNFTFISTDKAVNAKSVLGITKKFGEMIVEYKYHLKKDTSNYLIVRFGNVIGSAGSAIPLFIEQVKQGGPIVVKNKKTRRYFMSIEEAVELVLHSSLINKNFNIYALDMGNQIKIYDVVRRIIKACGCNIKNNQHPDGDIFIKIDKLNKGEKIQEELTLGKKLKKSSHPKILICRENNKYKVVPKKIIYLNNLLKNKKISRKFLFQLLN